MKSKNRLLLYFCPSKSLPYNDFVCAGHPRHPDGSVIFHNSEYITMYLPQKEGQSLLVLKFLKLSTLHKYKYTFFFFPYKNVSFSNNCIKLSLKMFLRANAHKNPPKGGNSWIPNLMSFRVYWTILLDFWFRVCFWKLYRYLRKNRQGCFRPLEIRILHQVYWPPKLTDGRETIARAADLTN